MFLCIYNVNVKVKGFMGSAGLTDRYAFVMRNPLP